MDLYKSRDRVAPWHGLMTQKALTVLKAGGQVERAEELGKLESARVSVRLWPDPPAQQFQSMALTPIGSKGGVVKFVALSPRESIALVFAMDVANSEHFVGGGTELMVWVGAAVPTGEMRC